MLPWFRCFLPALALTFSTVGCAAAAPVASPPSPAEMPVVWRLSDPQSFGDTKSAKLGETPPEAVADAAGRAALRFNGEDSGLLVPGIPISGAKAFSVEMLIRPKSGGPYEQRFLHFEDTAGARGLLELRLNEGGGWSLDAFLRKGAPQLVLHDPKQTHPADVWTWVAMTYDGRHLTSYVAGVKQLEGDVVIGPFVDGRTSLGVRQTLISWFAGEIAEVRWHRRTLAPAELQR